MPAKILIVSEIFSPVVGGSGAVARELAQQRPTDISIVAPWPDESVMPLSKLSAHDGNFGFKVYRVSPFFERLSRSIPGRLRGPLQYAYNLLRVRPKAAGKLREVILGDKPHVICINALLACYWVPAAVDGILGAAKVIFYLHGEEVNDGEKKYRLDLLAQSALRKADGVVVASSFTKQRAIRCGVDPAKIEVVSNGVDVQQFYPGPKSSSIVQSLALEGKKVLLCLARLDRRKGQDKLIDAMPEILAQVPETVLLLVGGGEDRSRLETLVTERKLQEQVRFTGPISQSDVVEFYRTADVYVMPNRTMENGDTEGFGLVFLEAGACGKPVIGGRAGGVPEAIIDGETGLLVDGTSSAEIGAACIRLLADTKLAQGMGAKGLAHARANTWQTQADRFVSYCQTLGAR